MTSSRYFLPPALLFLVFASAVATPLKGQDLGTTNETQIRHFWSAVQRSNGPVTALSFGDSVSVDYNSIQKSLFARMQERFGARGVAFTGWGYKEVGGGAKKVEWGPDWWADYTKVPPEGFVTWHPQTCDDVGVFWIARPDGGRFLLSAVQDNGATVTPLLTLDGYSPQPVGCFTNMYLVRANQGLRVDGLTGTNVFVGARLIDTSGKGIATGFLTRDGQNLRKIFDYPTNVLYPILAAINPQLVVWNMKELGDIGETVLSNKLYELEAMWRASVTNGDVVYIGTPWESRDAGAEWTVIQNRLVRQAAVRDGRAYIDCMTPCISYEAMIRYGLLGDIVHPSAVGNSVMANTIVWPQLGLGRLARGGPLEKRPLPAVPTWLTNASESLPVIGWATWTPEEGNIVLRNPIGTSGAISLDPQIAFRLPPGAPEVFDMRRCDRWSRVPVSLLQAGVSSLINLSASEATALEAQPRVTLLSIEGYQGGILLRWPEGCTLQHAVSPTGTWFEAEGAFSPWTVSATGSMQFFRTTSKLP